MATTVFRMEVTDVPWVSVSVSVSVLVSMYISVHMCVCLCIIYFPSSTSILSTTSGGDFECAAIFLGIHVYAASPAIHVAAH